MKKAVKREKGKKVIIQTKRECHLLITLSASGWFEAYHTEELALRMRVNPQHPMPCIFWKMTNLRMCNFRLSYQLALSIFIDPMPPVGGAMG